MIRCIFVFYYYTIFQPFCRVKFLHKFLNLIQSFAGVQKFIWYGGWVDRKNYRIWIVLVESIDDDDDDLFFYSTSQTFLEIIYNFVLY